jgi:hypothetical protein
LHLLYNNVQTPETEAQDYYDRNCWSKANFKRAGRMPALRGNVASVFSILLCIAFSDVGAG